MGGLPSIFLVVGAGATVGMVLLLTVRYPRRPEYYAALAAKLPHDDRVKPRID